MGYLKKLKNKKPGKSSDIFKLDCFFDKIENPIQITPQEFINNEILGHKGGKCFNLLDRRYKKNGSLNYKGVKKYVRFLNLLSKKIPDNIQEKYNQIINSEKNKINNINAGQKSDPSYSEISFLRKKSKKSRILKGRYKKKDIKKVKSLSKGGYDVYIKGPLWKDRKQLLFLEKGKQCIICKSVRCISVHHLFYNQNEYGKEKSKDLVILCWEHHKMFHDMYGVTKDSREQFEKFKSIILMAE